VKQNDPLALAWLRESARNGNVYSYLNAGDLCYEGGVNLQKNRMFALVNYLGAYQAGAVFLKERLEKLVKELKEEEGQRLPDFKFIETRM